MTAAWLPMATAPHCCLVFIEFSYDQLIKNYQPLLSHGPCLCPNDPRTGPMAPPVPPMVYPTRNELPGIGLSMGMFLSTKVTHILPWLLSSMLTNLVTSLNYII